MTNLLARINDFEELIPKTKQFIKDYLVNDGSNDPSDNSDDSNRLITAHLLSFGLYRMKLHGRSIARVLLELGYDNHDIRDFLGTTSLPISKTLFVSEAYRKAKQTGSYVDTFQLAHDFFGDMQCNLNYPFKVPNIDVSSYLADYGTYLLWLIKEFDKEDRHDFCTKAAKTIIETAKKRPVEQYLWMLELLRSEGAPLFAGNQHNFYDASLLDEAISLFSRTYYNYFISTGMKFDVLLDNGLFSSAEHVLPRVLLSIPEEQGIDWCGLVTSMFKPHIYDSLRAIDPLIRQSRGKSMFIECEGFDNGHFFRTGSYSGSLNRMMHAKYTGDNSALSDLEKEIMQKVNPENEFVYPFYLAGKLTGYSDSHILQSIDSLPLVQQSAGGKDVEPFYGFEVSGETEYGFKQKAKHDLKKIITDFKKWKYIEFVAEYVSLLESIRREQTQK